MLGMRKGDLDNARLLPELRISEEPEVLLK
jgi:hypothetical protein